MVIYLRTVDLSSDYSEPVPDYPVPDRLVPCYFELVSYLLKDVILLDRRVLKADPSFLLFHDLPLLLPFSSLVSERISFSNETGIEGSESFLLDFFPFLPFFKDLFGAKFMKNVGVYGFRRDF